MNEITTEQKQMVYEFLLDKGVPDLYAALIAERQVGDYSADCTVLECIGGNFAWSKTPEKRDFWDALDDELECNIPEYFENKVDIVLEDKPEVVEPVSENTTDYTIVSEQETEAPNLYLQPLDYEIKDGEVFSYAYKEEPELTFWQKIKFYAGRLFYKV